MAKSDASAVDRTTGSSVDEDLGVELRKLAQSVVIVKLREAPQTKRLSNIAITKILQRAKVPEEFHAEILKRIDMLKASRDDVSISEFLAWIDDLTSGKIIATENSQRVKAKRRSSGRHRNWSRQGTVRGSLRYNAKVAVHLKRGKEESKRYAETREALRLKLMKHKDNAAERLRKRLEARR